MIVVPVEVVERVREHALRIDAEQPGHESLGVLVLDGDHALRYAPLANGSRRPNRVRFQSERQLRRPGGLPLIATHSHPRSEPVPSDLDLRWADSLGLDVFAIYSIPADALKLWRLGDGSPQEVAWSLAP